MPRNYFPKDPDAIKDFEIDWSSYLGSDTISTSAWTVAAGITEDSDTKTTTTTTIFLSGGTAGQIYELVNRITTAGARTEDASIFIEVDHDRVHTIGGKYIERIVRLEVADDEQPYEYTTAVLNRAIAAAVRWYSEMRPYVKSNSFTTVKAQGLYALPSDALRVIELHYKIANTDEFYTQYSEVYPFDFTEYDSESLTIIRNKLVQAYEKHAHYMWEQITFLTSYQSGRYVILYPEPDTSGLTVNFRYTREHDLNGSDYPTIPGEDSDQFTSMVVLALERRELARIMRAPARYRDGQTEMDRRGTLSVLRTSIDNRSQEIFDSFSRTSIQAS